VQRLARMSEGGIVTGVGELPGTPTFPPARKMRAFRKERGSDQRLPSFRCQTGFILLFDLRHSSALTVFVSSDTFRALPRTLLCSCRDNGGIAEG
jgi:hypothetical protein